MVVRRKRRQVGRKWKWESVCPTCGSDRSSLLGSSHDYMIDCPKCRPGPSGRNGKKDEAETVV